MRRPTLPLYGILVVKLSNCNYSWEEEESSTHTRHSRGHSGSHCFKGGFSCRLRRSSQSTGGKENDSVQEGFRVSHGCRSQGG